MGAGRLHRHHPRTYTDVGRDTIDQLTVITEQLCCKYVSRPSEIIAWSFEMSAWFALTQGRLRSVLDYTDAGIKAAPHASVAVQLAAQATRAHGRMGNRTEARRELDRGFRLLNGHEHPTRPENHNDVIASFYTSISNR